MNKLAEAESRAERYKRQRDAPCGHRPEGPPWAACAALRLLGGKVANDAR